MGRSQSGRCSVYLYIGHSGGVSAKERERQWRQEQRHPSYEKTDLEKELERIMVLEAELVQSRSSTLDTSPAGVNIFVIATRILIIAFTNRVSFSATITTFTARVNESTPLPESPSLTPQPESPSIPAPAKTEGSSASRRPKIYDHFLCNDEMDMIEIRFRELDSVVDRFFVF